MSKNKKEKIRVDICLSDFSYQSNEFKTEEEVKAFIQGLNTGPWTSFSTMETHYPKRKKVRK